MGNDFDKLKTWVYFATYDGGPIKIGLTKDLNKRLRQLNTGTDKDIYYIGAVRGGYTHEKHIHHKFKHLRLKNEWFEKCGELVDFIQLIKDKSIELPIIKEKRWALKKED